MPGLSVQVPEQTRVNAIRDFSRQFCDVLTSHTAHILTQCVTRIYWKKKSRVTFISEILYVFLCTDLLVLLFYWHLEIAEKLKLWLAPLKNLSDTTACSEMTEKNP